VLIDLHTHTKRHSWDSSLDPHQLIALAKAAGLDGICLTEHDYFWDPGEVQALAAEHQFLVLPAVEVNTEAGHVLCFGLERYVYGMHRWEELAGHVAQASGVMVAAHPYRRQVAWNQQTEDAYEQALPTAIKHPFYRTCVALEAMNGRGSTLENWFSQQLASHLALPATGGSDAHDPQDVGRSATRFERPIRSLGDLIGELKAGRYRPVAPARRVAAPHMESS